VLYDSYGSLYGLYEASGRLQWGEICEKRGRCCILNLIKSVDCILEREVEVKMGEIMNLLLGDVFPFFCFLSIFVMSTYHMGRMHAHTDRMRVDRFGLLLFLPLEMLPLITNVSSLYRPFSS
jgi:hypothetical protein